MFKIKYTLVLFFLLPSILLADTWQTSSVLRNSNETNHNTPKVKVMPNKPKLSKDDKAEAKALKKLYNERSERVAESLDISIELANKLDHQLQQRILNQGIEESLNCIVLLNEQTIYYRNAENISVNHLRNGEIVVIVNGAVYTKEDYKAYRKEQKELLKLEDSERRKANKELLKTVKKFFKEKYINSLYDTAENDGLSYIIASLKKYELIELLTDYQEHIVSIGLKHKIEYSALENNTSLEATGVKPILDQNQSLGTGFGVYYADFNCSDPSYVDGNYDILNNGDSGLPNSGYENHTFLISGIISDTSPSAYKYCRSLGNYALNLINSFGDFPTQSEYDTANNNDTPIVSESYSFNYGTNTQEYITDDATFDNHIVTANKLVFISAGNDEINHQIEAPAHAVNTITVGSYGEKRGASKYYEGSSSPFSTWLNPDIGTEKPEIVAPGESYLYSYNGYSSWNNQEDNGTSYATPHSAALFASALSQLPQEDVDTLTGSVATAKAYMIASATDRIHQSDRNITDVNESAIGAGGIEYSTMLNVRDLFESYDANGTGTFTIAHPDNNGTLDAYCTNDWSFYLEQGEYARVALAWMIDGDWVLGKSNTEFPLGDVYWYGIYPPSYQDDDDQLFLSHEQKNNDWRRDAWIYSDFTAPETGNYLVVACRTIVDNSPSVINVGAAVTVYEKPFNPATLVPINQLLLLD
jgi:hypothetical protein